MSKPYKIIPPLGKKVIIRSSKVLPSGKRIFARWYGKRGFVIIVPDDHDDHDGGTTVV